MTHESPHLLGESPSSGGMNGLSPIGIATLDGADVHAVDCHFAVCRAHRELEERIDDDKELEQIIAAAEHRSWLLNPWFLVRKLNGPESDEEEVQDE